MGGVAVSGVFAKLQATVDGIVVGGFDAFVDFTGVGCETVRAKDIVDTHMDAVFVVGETRTVGGGDITVGQPFGYRSVGIRKGSVVEVATHDDMFGFTLGDVSCHGICLRCPFAGGIHELVGEAARHVGRLLVLQVALYHAFEAFFVAGFSSSTVRESSWSP